MWREGGEGGNVCTLRGREMRQNVEIEEKRRKEEVKVREEGKRKKRRKERRKRKKRENRRKLEVTMVQIHVDYWYM